MTHTHLSPQDFTILLAEEDETLRDAMAAMLRKDGFRVVEVEDGLEMEDYLEGSSHGELKPPDVIVSAVVMPGQTGLEVLERYCQEPTAPPFIVLSSEGDMRSLDEAERLGADYIFEKPLNIADVGAAVYSIAS